MGFIFKIQLIGLCHFIENKDDDSVVQLCVLLPRADVGSFSNRAHRPRLVYQAENRVGGSAPQGVGPQIEWLTRKRVAFRFVAAPGVAPLPASLKGKLGKTLAVEDLIAKPGRYVNFVKDPLPQEINSQILLHAGSLAERKVAADWLIPQADTQAQPIRRRLPPFAVVTVKGLERVDVLLQPLKGGKLKTVSLSGSGKQDEVVFITISADCGLRRAMGPPPAPIEANTPDVDFRAHYVLFQDLKAKANRLPVPIQVAPGPAAGALLAETARLDVLAHPLPRLVFKRTRDFRKAHTFSGPYVTLKESNGELEVESTGRSGGGCDCQNCQSRTQQKFDLDAVLRGMLEE